MAKKNSAKPVKSAKESKSNVKNSLQCEACKSQCTEGLAYINKLKAPGAIGYGVHCKN